MRYIVTIEKVKEVDVAPATQLAIATFKKLLRTERRFEYLEKELQQRLSEVPEEDMRVYVEVTEEMIKRG